MASIYRRAQSPFWWIKYKRNGRTLRESTKFRRDLPAETRRARIYMHECAKRELEGSRHEHESRWELWVEKYLQARYGATPPTHGRYLIGWHNLRTFFQIRDILYPAQLSRENCLDFLAWRKTGDRTLGIQRGHHNTVIGELKFLHLLLDEAMRRDYCVKNVAAGLGIRKVPPKEKPEISPADLCIMRERLKSEPEWMQVSFEIALTTGLRMRETAIPLGWIDLERHQFTVIAKGGRPFTSKFDPMLLPLFARLKQERGENAPACDIPYNASRIWCRFFRQLGMPYCFHCLRVSFISRCARAGVPEAIAMRLVNHASTTVHRVYVRVRPEDTERYLEMVRIA